MSTTKIDCTVLMKHRIKPVPGTVTGPEGKETGQCPTCDTPGIHLSVVGGFIRKHTVADKPVPENNPTPRAVTVAAVKAGDTGPTACTLPGSDEPIKVKHKIDPVPGTVRNAVTGEFKGKTIKHPDQAGECPECRGMVPLSGKGKITAHTRGNAPQPASVQLTERSVVPVDTGAQNGDPDPAQRRRTTELEGAFEAGTVMVPVPGKNGRTKLEEAEGTEENLRAALAYWIDRKPRTDASKAAQSKNVSELTRRLEALRGAAVVVHLPVDAPVTTDVVTRQDPAHTTMGAQHSPEGHTTSALTGAPVVKGRPMEPFAGTVRTRKIGEPYVRPAPARDTRTGYERAAGTLSGPLGRDRLDRVAAEVPEPEPELSASQKRNRRRRRTRDNWQARHLAAPSPKSSKGKGKGKGK